MKIGLTLSGGGFRATAFHLGVVRYLREAQLLEHVTHICSVSGGSILAAHLVLNWDRYNGSEEEFLEAQAEVQDFMRRDIRGRIIRRAPAVQLSKLIPQGFPFLGGLHRSRANLFQGYLAEHLYKHQMLESLPPHPRLHILTTNMTTGALCSFTREGFSRDIPARSPLVPNPVAERPEILPSVTVPIALAVTASAAFPALFRPIRISYELLGVDKTKYIPNDQAFTDGGVFDNLGVRKLVQLDHFLQKDEKQGFDHVIISDAGATFERRWGKGPSLIHTAMRASDILSKRIYDLARGWLEDLERLSVGKHGKHRGRVVDVRISTVVEQQPHSLVPAVQRHVQYLRTDLDRFSSFEMQSLIQHGYFVARSACRRRKLPGPDAIPPDLATQGGLPHDEQVRQLQKGGHRMLRLVSLRDPATYVTALLGLGLLIGVQLLSTKVWSPIAAEIAQRWHPAITIRGKNFLESSILVEMMALQIERELPDVPVERDHYHYKNMLSVYPELLDEEKGLDLYPEYSATLLANFLDKTPRRGASASETADEINELLEERNAPVVFLQPFGYTNNYEIAMRKDRADCLLRLSGQDGQYTLRALATASQKQTGMKTCLKRDGPLLFGSSSDFEKRKDGLRILSNGPKAGYGVRIRWSHHVDHDDIYKALRSGQIDVADGYAADPELQPGREEFVMLADVDGRFPDYWPAPLIRRAMLERYPGVRAALEKLTRNEKIDQKLITELTEEAMRWGLDDDLDRDKPGPYARDHLRLLVEERLVNEGILEPRD